MMTSDGNTATCSKLMVHSTEYGRRRCSRWTMKRLNRWSVCTSERIFAWRERHAHMLEWEQERVQQALTRAVSTIETSVTEKKDCTNAALFDPEFGQMALRAICGPLVFATES